MKLRSVDIQNFMAIGEARLDLADRGLCLIQGENADESSADSNGAGKSSIADAISWCLYGLTARGEDGDKVVNRTVGKDCQVTIVIEDGLEFYSIQRHRKHKTGKNSVVVTKDAFPAGVDLTKGTAALTQKVIDQIIGCSYDVFCGAVYAGQERMPDLPGKSDKELKMLIEEASGATLLEAAYQEANRRLREAQIALTNVDAGVLRCIGIVDAAKERLKLDIERRDGFEKMRIDNIKRWHTAGVEQKAFIVASQAKLSDLGDKADIESQIKVLDAKIAAVDAEFDTERKLSDLGAMALSNQRAAQTAYANAEKLFISIDDSITALDHKIGCPCGECDRPLTTEDIAPARKLANERLASAKTAQVAAYKALDEATTRAKNAVEKRDTFRASITDLSKTNAVRASLQAQVKAIFIQENEIENLKSDLDLLVRQIKAKQVEPNPYTGDITKATGAITAAEYALAGVREKQVKANETVQLQEAVAKVFSPAGVRAFLLDEVTPFLNDQTAKYLGNLSDGHISATWTTLVRTAKGELREKFSIEVTSSTGGDTFKGISGGEKRKVRIACALALQDLVARRATKPIELFIGDEIDDALDDAGRQRLMDILQEKAKERGSVFIISHSDLKDWIRNQVTVKKVGGKSTIEEVEA